MHDALKEFQIDPATGLPMLPEGYFWEIGENEDRDYHGGSVDIVKLMGPGEVTKTRDVTKTLKRRWWEFTPRTVTEPEEFEEAGTVLIYSEDFEFEGYKDKVERPDCSKITSEWTSFGGVERVAWEVDFSPEGILYIATMIWAWFVDDTKFKQEKADKEALRKALYGSYPPKTLVVPSEA